MTIHVSSGGGGGGGGGSSKPRVCKDPKATNYESYGLHRQSLCEYSDITTEEDDTDTTEEPVVSSLDTKQCPHFTKYYKKGQRGGEIYKIQTFLKDQGLYNSTIDGIYGPITDRAIKAFQAKYPEEILKPWGLTKPTGWWFKTTRSKANELAGCGKENVIINYEIYDITATNKLEVNNRQLLMEQLKAQIKALQDEIKRRLALLNSQKQISLDTKQCPHFTKYYKKGQRGGEIYKIQTFLKDQGLYNSTIDGIYGPITDRAIKAFQAKYPEEILKPWGLTKPTGWWFKTTRAKANELAGCEKDSYTLDYRY